MKKWVRLKYVSVVMVLLVAVGVGTVLAHSNVPTVIYDGATQTFTYRNDANGDLFHEFKDLMPGDVRTQTIRVEVENPQENTALYLRGKPVEGNADILEPLQVTIRQNGILAEKTSMTNSLSRNVLLGTFSKNGGFNLNVELEVPVTVDNALAEAQGIWRWVFTAQTAGDGGGGGTGSGDYEDTSRFSDISGHWAEEHIRRAAGRGWVEGYGDGTFRPDQFITRAEAVTLVNRVLNRVPKKEEHLLDEMQTWTDNMNPDKWYYLAIQEASNSHDYSRFDADSEYWTNLRSAPAWKAYDN